MCSTPVRIDTATMPVFFFLSIHARFFSLDDDLRESSKHLNTLSLLQLTVTILLSTPRLGRNHGFGEEGALALEVLQYFRLKFGL